MKTIQYSLLILTIIGIVNALYLTTVVYPEAISNPQSQCNICTFGQPEVWSCSDVARSPDAQLFGIYFPFIALFVYPLLAILLVLSLFCEKKKNLFLTTGLLGTAGFLMNSYFLYEEIFSIKKVCGLCLICLVTITLIAIFSFIAYRKASRV